MKKLILPLLLIIAVCNIPSNCFAQKDTIVIDGIKVLYSPDSERPTIKTFAIEDTFAYFSLVDTNYNRYALPATFAKPNKWLEAEKARIEREHCGNVYPETFNLETVLSIIDTALDFGRIRSAKSWCLKNYEQVFPHLIARLSMKKKIGLETEADLIIWERVRTGDLKFYGHGGGMNEDIFTIAGRVSWILNKLTGEDFALVGISLTEKQAEEFKNDWTAYITKLK